MSFSTNIHVSCSFQERSFSNIRLFNVLHYLWIEEYSKVCKAKTVSSFDKYKCWLSAEVNYSLARVLSLKYDGVVMAVSAASISRRLWFFDREGTTSVCTIKYSIVGIQLVTWDCGTPFSCFNSECQMNASTSQVHMLRKDVRDARVNSVCRHPWVRRTGRPCWWNRNDHWRL